MDVRKYIDGCISGNRMAHKALYEQCAPYVYSIVQRYIYRKDERKDVMQEAFAKIFTKIHQFDNNKGSFKLWIRKITVNECLQYLRKIRKLRFIDTSLQTEQIQVIDRTSLPTDLSRSDIEKLLDQMPKGYKIIFMLKVIDGYDHKEIAEMLDIDPKTSRSQLSRAKNWLRDYLNTNSKSAIHELF